MACNSCGSTTNCIEPCVGTDCTCVISDQSTDCSVYTGTDLPCTGTVSGTVLTTVIQNLDSHICDLFATVTSSTTSLVNIGTGAGVFKQVTGAGINELRSITSTDTTTLIVTENTDTIDITAGLQSLSVDNDDIVLSVTTNAVITELSRITERFTNATTWDSATKLLTLNNTGYADITQDLSSLASVADLASNINGLGASTIGIEDLAGNFTATTVEGALAEISAGSSGNSFSTAGSIIGTDINITGNAGFTAFNIDVSSLATDADLASNANGLGASTIGIEDVAGNIIATTVEGALAELRTNPDVLETSPASVAYIENKNPQKSVPLGAAGVYTVLDADNNYVIEIDNGGNNVTIDLTSITLTGNMFVGFIQRGTGTVTFTGQDQLPSGLTSTMIGQGHNTGLEVINSTKYLLGGLA